MLAAFARAFPDLDPAANFVIPNGFEAMAQNSVDAPLTPAKSGHVDIVHAGEIFTGRSLVPVLRAAASLRARHPDRPVRVITFGDLPPVELARIRAERLEEFVEVRPRVPFAALFEVLRRAHLLLAVVGEHMVYSTPYKVYDYMAAGRPILGIAPAGAALFDLLKESGAGLCVARDDAAGIERAIEQCVLGEVAPLRARVERYRWQNLALQYRAVIEQVAGAAEAMPARPSQDAMR
jgi:glycosyltransferase involved in cell wall biosynthesis